MLFLNTYQFFSDGDNYDSADYAKIIEEIQEITLAVNSTFRIPIIYGLDHIHGAHYVANSKSFQFFTYILALILLFF